MRTHFGWVELTYGNLRMVEQVGLAMLTGRDRVDYLMCTRMCTVCHGYLLTIAYMWDVTEEFSEQRITERAIPTFQAICKFLSNIAWV